MLPEVGQVVAEKYKVERELGRGGMGVVFAAHHVLLDKPVAMKILAPELRNSPHLVERFLSEARAAARVDSAYVARVIDVDTLDDGLPFIVMERLEGVDLEEHLASRGRLPRADVVDYGLQALQGLAHAHVLGVIHRDLKPANLFLARQTDGSVLVKILDFGIAKLVEEARKIASGATVGSPTYMSPEQVRDAELVDPRADIWSIGVVLYELLAGRTPFEAEGIGATITAVLERTPEPVRALRPDVPEELDAAILRCMAQDPEARFADVGELAAAIAPFGSGACVALVESIELTLRQRKRPFAGAPAVNRSPPSGEPRVLAPVRVAFGNDADGSATFLYGDSTPSSLQTNFLAFLGDAMDAFSKILVFDDVITRGREDVERLPREAADETQRIEALVEPTRAALAGVPTLGPESPAGRVAVGTLQHLEGAVATEVAALRANLESALAAIPGKEKAAREGCARAFDELLLRHDLPGAEVALVLRRTGERYSAMLEEETDYGLKFTIELDVPAKHAFATAVRLEKIAKLEVEAPELTGWIRKEIKLRPQRLDRHWISALVLRSTGMTLSLSSQADGEGGSFEVALDLLTSTYQLARAGGAAPYDLSDHDSAKVLEVHTQLLAIAKELARSRKRVVTATLDGAPLWVEHPPRQVVDRIAAILAPITSEIAVHSLSTSELVLKRMASDNRREEVFVSRAALLAKLDPVPERVRVVLADVAHAVEELGLRSSQPSVHAVD